MTKTPAMVALSNGCESAEGTTVECCDLAICTDLESHAALVVVRVNSRVRSWWSSRRSAEATLARYRAEGLKPAIEIPETVRHVIERRWPEVEGLRAEIARA